MIVKGDGKIIAGRVSRADTFFLRFKGLLGRKKLEPGQGLLLEPCRQIHTFFMAFPLDVLYLDQQGRILTAIENLVPGRLGPWVREAVQVLELSPGVIRHYNLMPGQVLEFDIIK